VIEDETGLCPACRWRLAPPPPKSLVDGLPDVDPVAVRCLYRRGIDDAAAAKAFLDAVAVHDDPFDLAGMSDAVSRLLRAIEAGEQIVVYGDFDADGVTATAALTETLSALGARVLSFIPHRERDGYGLRMPTIEHLAQGGAQLLVTVDCGIRAHEEIEFAREQGVDVIVTDHHSLPEQLPAAVAIINPSRRDCGYVHGELSGVGLAYKLCQGLMRTRPAADARVTEDSLLDLVAIGTVADVVPLVGENRALVRRGVQVLRQARRPGVRALLEVARREPATITARDIAFVIGPRVNAAGRMDSADTALALLRSDDLSEARRLADQIEAMNTERRAATERAVTFAQQQLSDSAASWFLLAASPEIPAGVAGLVAGRLAGAYRRPVAALHVEGDLARGSARSVPGFNLVGALEGVADSLVRFGGHAQAAGFTVHLADLDAVASRLDSIARAELEGRDLRRVLEVDAEVGPEELTWALHSALAALEPHGEGNPRPLFMLRDVPVSNARVVGNDHLRFVVEGGGERGSIDAIAFGQARCLPRIGSRMSLVCSLEENVWRGQRKLELHVEDMAHDAHAVVEKSETAVQADDSYLEVDIDDDTPATVP